MNKFRKVKFLFDLLSGTYRTHNFVFYQQKLNKKLKNFETHL
jgi:hypothetical protein